MDDERFILEVQKYNILYDTTDPFYKDNTRKDNTWNIIAGVIGVTGEEVITKLLITKHICLIITRV